MTGIKNKAGKSGCNHCRDETHWMDNCPHLHVTSEALEKPFARKIRLPRNYYTRARRRTKEVSPATILAWANWRAWLSFCRRPASPCD